MGRRLTIAMAAVLVAGMLFAAGAGARTITPYSDTGSFDGSTSTGGKLGSPSFMAFNQQTQRLLVVDRGATTTEGRVIQFDALGNPVPFSDPGLNGDSSIPFGSFDGTTLVGGALGPDIAVDNSGTASEGNIYVLQPPSTLHGLDSTGKKLPGDNWPMCGANCGKTADWSAQVTGVSPGLDGTIWTTTFLPYAFTPFDTNGSLSTKYSRQVTSEGLEQTIYGETGPIYLKEGATSNFPRRFDIDSQGNFYVWSSSALSNVSSNDTTVMKYAPDAKTVLNEAVAPPATNYLAPNGANNGRQADLTVDRTTDRLFVGEGERIGVYDSDGQKIDSFGEPEGGFLGVDGGRSPGVAIDSATKKVYVSNQRGIRGIGTTTAGSDVITNVSVTAGFYPFQVGRTIIGSGLNQAPTPVTILSMTANTITVSRAATSSQTNAVFSQIGDPTVEIFSPGAPMTVPDVTTEEPTTVTATSATMNGTVDPDNGGAITSCVFRWGPTFALANSTPCSGALPGDGGSPVAVSAPLAGLTKGTRYHYRLVVSNQPAAAQPQTGTDQAFRAANAPVVTNLAIADVNTDTVQSTFTLDPQGGDTTYTIEVGETPSYGMTFTGSPRFTWGTAPIAPLPIVKQVEGLEPDTLYHYRITAENEAGVFTGTDRTFKTFPFVAELDDSCPNNLARQQTGAALLLDCRAYELVSAADQGGYNVESDLAPGQEPFSGYPRADDKVLYAVHNGGIPNTGNPTNRGPDPYIATRDEANQRWSTEYVGIPSNGTPDESPFSSTLASADDGLGTFAFAGPEICDPCFADNSINVPLRLPDGSLVKGMAGSLNPAADPSGQVDKRLSADGSHFIFGSEERFEPLGNDNNGSVTIYDRDLNAGTTQIASTLPGGATMTGSGISALDVSEDGSRILIGKLVSTDSAGNQYWDLYMHIGTAAGSVLIADTANGVLYNGMTADGSAVYFTTPDQVATDGDLSVDLFRADVGTASASSTAVTTTDNDACNPASNSDGNNWNAVGGASPDACGAVAVGGGGGVASDSGDVYFLSPEQLDGAEGTLNQPNLYLAEPGASPRFIATLEPNNSLVRNSVAANGKRFTGDFQVNPSGDDAVFATTLSFEGYENLNFSQVLHFDREGDALACISCPTSNAPQTGDAGLATHGLSITDDGRIFFNSVDRLVLRDANKKRDAYEWTPEDGGTVELISTGMSDQNSSLLTVTADGRDAFFFTRQKLVSADLNGPIVKIYDAREQGGFFVIPQSQACQASDECHGPGTLVAPPAPIRTKSGTDGQITQLPTKKCKKGFVKKRGKCVKKKSRKGKKKRPNATNRTGVNR
jgi:hypothetical protein